MSRYVVKMIESALSFDLLAFGGAVVGDALMKDESEYQPPTRGSVSGGASAIPDLIDSIKDVDPRILLNIAVWLIPFAPREALLGGAILYQAEADPVVSDIANLIDSNAHFRSLYTLAPLRNKFQKQIDTQALRDNSEINIRLVSIVLEDIKTAWFDKNSWEFQVVESVSSNDFQTFGFRHPRMPSMQTIKRHKINPNLTDIEVIERASLGSAAIPLAFEPIEIPLEREAFYVIDGGARDVLPGQACISQLRSEAKDVRVVSIFCNPLSGYKSPYY